MLFAQFVQFFFEFEAFEAGELAQADFENVFGLDFGEAERRHQVGFRVVRLADDFNHFVDVQKDFQTAFENVQPFFHLREAEFQTTCYGNNAKIQPFLQNGFQVFLRGAVVQTHHHQIHRHIAFERGLRHQRVDEHVGVGAAGFGLEHKAHGVFAVGFVAHAVDEIQHQFFGVELVLVELFFARFGFGVGLFFDFGEDFRGIGVGRQLGNNHAPLAACEPLDFVTRPHAHAAFAGFVNPAQIRRRCDDLPAADKIGRGDKFH